MTENKITRTPLTEYFSQDVANKINELYAIKFIDYFAILDDSDFEGVPEIINISYEEFI